MSDIETCPECGVITSYIITDNEDTETPGELCFDCAKKDDDEDEDEND